MTKEQKALFSLLLSQNEQSKEAGEPYLRAPRTALEEIAKNTKPDIAAAIVADYSTGNLYPEKSPKDIDDTGKIELLLWLVYMRNGGNKGWDSGGDSWALIRHALAELIEQGLPFVKMAQNKAINALPALFKTNLQIDVLGNATGDANGVNFIIDGYASNAEGLKAQTYMLNDALLIKYTQTRSQTIELPLKEYAEMRGLTGKTKDQLKNLRKEVVSALSLLASISYQCKERVKGKMVDSGLIRINGGTAIVKNGVIRWNYNTDLIPWLERLPPMDYSRETLTADPRTNQYFFSRYIDQNYRVNEGRERVSTISIKTLLSKAQNLPTIEEVRKGRHSPKARIIQPFFRDLDNIERLYYDVIGKDGQIIADPTNLDYDTFIQCSIRVDYSEYETHPERVKKRVRHIEHK
ncbi:hypothetical protein [Ruminococcus bicirculans (ex Wegman et al. 2014)]|uniref:hypothetical protein n=1 Tax=Ruminococcus bicirculans (ex Wegman et al. 2014) TaxID=1160721 RepID=UPI00399B032F